MVSRTVCFIAFTIIPVCSLLAKSYQIETNSKDVTCTLKTLSKKQMLQLTGNFGSYYLVQEEHDHIGTHIGSKPGVYGGHTTTKKERNLFEEASNRFMVVIVNVKNDSSDTILLPAEGEYIEGVEDYFVDKEELVPSYKSLAERNDTWALTSYILGGITAAGATIGGLGAIGAPNPDSKITAGILSIFSGGLSALGFYIGHNKKETAEHIRKHMQKFLNQTNIKQKNGYFVIPPNKPFRDIFLIDLEREGSGRGVLGRIPLAMNHIKK